MGDGSFVIPQRVQSYWHLSNSDASKIEPAGSSVADQKVKLTYTLEKDDGAYGYWSLTSHNETSSDPHKETSLQFVLVLDNYIPQDSFWEFSGLHATSIFTLYSIILFSIGSIVRNSCTNSVKDIPTKDLNDVKLLYRLAQAIRLANVQGKYYLEEQLYRVLVR